MTYKKKVAIVSCYFIHNYGSMIQAYATQKILNKIGIENETINVSGFIRKFRKDQYIYILKSGITSEIFRDRLGKAKNLIVKKFLNNSYTKNIGQRDNEFEQFAKKYINKSEIYFSLDELREKCVERYTTVLIGSDQLWLPANIAANYYTLDWVPEKVNTVAYATSFGVAKLPDNIVDKASKFLEKIRHISVREKSGQSLVSTLVGRDVSVVCDPTLLFNGDEWMEIQSVERIYNDKYIFCYFIGEERQHREFASRLRKLTGCKIVALIHIDHYVKSDECYADFTPFDIGPCEFLNLIRNAEYVCTDSFHATVFSILYKKEFFEFKRYVKKTKMSTNNRIETLFDSLGIKDRIFVGDENVSDLLDKKIDYSSIQVKLDMMREEAYKYLYKAINDDGSTDI